MEDWAIRIEHLYKKYPYSPHDGKATSSQVDHWVLKDINLEVPKGATIGILGKNGAGKTTLLKIIARISPPTQGKVETDGQVHPLLNLGGSFDHALTGRENVFFTASLYGFSPKQIQKSIDQILEFSEIDPAFFDHPVKYYSRGMYSRLAFSVAIHLHTDILLLDEVLEVGDHAFQQKCLQKIKHINQEGGTVVLVSHNLSRIRDMCQKAVLLNGHSIQKYGDVPSVMEAYLRKNEIESYQIDLCDLNREGGGEVRLQSLSIINPKSYKPLDRVISGDPVLFQVEYKHIKPYISAQFGIEIQWYSLDGHFLTSFNSLNTQNFRDQLSQGVLHCQVDRFPMMPGKYLISLVAFCEHHIFDQLDRFMAISIERGDFYQNGFDSSYRRQGVFVPQKWW